MPSISSYISRILWPFVFGLLLMQTGCSSDTQAETEQQDTDGTRLTITTRAISNVEDIDNYISTLRLIVVKNGEAYNVCLNEYFERKTNLVFESKNGYVAEMNGTDDKMTINVPLSSRGTGIYTFYLIANEKDYIQPGFSYDKTLTSTLSVITRATSAAEVAATLDTNALRVKYAGTLRAATSRYMLMTATEQYMVYAGRENNIGSIELVRAMARVDFVIQNNVADQELTFSNVTVEGSVPDEIYVMQSSVFTPDDANTGETVVAAKATAGKAVTFYLPERLLAEADEADKGKALQISFTAKDGYGREKTYTDQIYIGPYESGSKKYTGYGVKRNTYYTITARLNKWSEMPYIETTVKPWKYKTYEEDFDMLYSVTITLPSTGVGQETSGYVFYDTDAVLTFAVTNLEPADAICMAEIDPEFDSVTTSGNGEIFAIEKMETTDTDGKRVCIFKVKPGANADDKAHTLALFLYVNGDRYPIHLCSVKYNNSAS